MPEVVKTMPAPPKKPKPEKIKYAKLTISYLTTDGHKLKRNFVRYLQAGQSFSYENPTDINDFYTDVETVSGTMPEGGSDLHIEVIYQSPYGNKFTLWWKRLRGFQDDVCFIILICLLMNFITLFCYPELPGDILDAINDVGTYCIYELPDAISAFFTGSNDDDKTVKESKDNERDDNIYVLTVSFVDEFGDSILPDLKYRCAAGTKYYYYSPEIINTITTDGNVTGSYRVWWPEGFEYSPMQPWYSRMGFMPAHNLQILVHYNYYERTPFLAESFDERLGRTKSEKILTFAQRIMPSDMCVDDLPIYAEGKEYLHYPQIMYKTINN